MMGSDDLVTFYHESNTTDADADKVPFLHSFSFTPSLPFFVPSLHTLIVVFSSSSLPFPFPS
jgi:hypothetical protein